MQNLKPNSRRDVSEPGNDEPADLDFARSLLSGLREEQKQIPCRFLYDAKGSELFEAITELPEYYPTRTEASILKACAGELKEATPENSLLVEFGSGSSTKTEILIAALDKLAGYVAIEISPTALSDAMVRLRERFPDLALFPVVGDFTSRLELSEEFEGVHRLGFFPGSTIGNLRPENAVALLKTMRETLTSSVSGAPQSARLVIGADLKKDVDVLERAYDDAQGVTAAFNLNLLERANRDLNANFQIGQFRHEAIYDNEKGRVDLYLVSLQDQTVQLLGSDIHFKAGERIHTEHSHKYSIDDFQSMARQAGWQPLRVFTDPDGLFSVHELGIGD